MAIPEIAPRTILLSPRKEDVVIINHLVCSDTPTPGALAELHKDTTLKWRVNSSATEQPTRAVFLNQPEHNKGIDDAYAAGDLAEVAMLPIGAVFYGFIESGQDISFAELLQSAGDGSLITAATTTADAALAKFVSLSDPGAVTARTRVKAMVI